MNTLIIDKSEIIKINQNDNTFFIIKKTDKWKNCIEIRFNTSEEINYINLYLILKSYALNNDFLCYSIATNFKNIDNKIIVSQNENINYIRKLKWYEFEEWINFRIDKDSTYDKKDNFYSITILFQNDLINIYNKKYDIDVLKYLKPNYPWNDNLLNSLQKSKIHEEVLIQKIKILENRLKYDKITKILTLFLSIILFIKFL